MMKGLKYLGELLTSYPKSITKPITREVQKKIREKINPEKICDWCLEDYSHQTQKGHKLCQGCYDDYLYFLEMAER